MTRAVADATGQAMTPEFMGKTSIALNIAKHVAKTSSKTVAVFSLEMSREQLATRLLAGESLVDSQKLLTGQLSSAEWQRIGEAASTLSETDIRIDDNPSLSVAEMNSQCRRLENLGLVVIDYLQLMNCPGSILVYDLEPHSYKELPLRYGELGIVHRHELSGALHGMFRVRCFTQDDAHILLAPEQIRDEVVRIAQLFDEVYGLFQLPYTIELSTMYRIGGRLRSMAVRSYGVIVGIPPLCCWFSNLPP